MRILLIEDDPLLGEAIAAGLMQESWSVHWVQDVGAATVALVDHAFSAAVLDLGLPDADGGTWLARLRGRGDALPVLVASARDGIGARIAVLDRGADDFLVKPFDLDELAARLRALVRRSAGRGVNAIVHGALSLDPARHAVTLGGAPVELAAREYAVLAALLERPGALLSRGQLEQRVYGAAGEVGSNAIEVHVHALRRKLGTASILTVRGIGYRLGTP